MFCILIMGMFSSVYTTETYLKWMYFIVHKLFLNKFVKKILSNETLANHRFAIFCCKVLGYIYPKAFKQKVQEDKIHF